MNDSPPCVVSLLSWQTIFKIKFSVDHAPIRPSLSQVHTVVSCGHSAQHRPRKLLMVTWDNGYMLWRALWSAATTFGLCDCCRILKNLANCTCVQPNILYRVSRGVLTCVCRQQTRQQEENDLKQLILQLGTKLRCALQFIVDWYIYIYKAYLIIHVVSQIFILNRRAFEKRQVTGVARYVN